MVVNINEQDLIGIISGHHQVFGFVYTQMSLSKVKYFKIKKELCNIS